MRITILAITCIVLITAGSLNAWEVKFVPQSVPLEIKEPPADAGDKIIVKEPIKIPAEVMTHALEPKLPAELRPAPVVGIGENGEGDAETAPVGQAGTGVIGGEFEEVEANVPIGPAVPPDPYHRYPALPQGAQTAGPAGDNQSAGPPPAGGCGKPILAGIIMEGTSENIEAQDAGAAEGEHVPYPYEYPLPEYYYDDVGAGAPTRAARPPGIYFRDEEEEGPPAEEEEQR